MFLMDPPPRRLNSIIHPTVRRGVKPSPNDYDVEKGKKVSRPALALPPVMLAPVEGAVDTFSGALYIRYLIMAVAKIQIGQLWKKNGTRDIYLVTRLYTEALSTMVVMRKSGSEGEALIRVRVERVPGGQNIPGFTPAHEEERL
jgi:hypothetical protein